MHAEVALPITTRQMSRFHSVAEFYVLKTSGNFPTARAVPLRLPTVLYFHIHKVLLGWYIMVDASPHRAVNTQVYERDSTSWRALIFDFTGLTRGALAEERPAAAEQKKKFHLAARQPDKFKRGHGDTTLEYHLNVSEVSVCLLRLSTPAAAISFYGNATKA